MLRPLYKLLEKILPHVTHEEELDEENTLTQNGEPSPESQRCDRTPEKYRGRISWCTERKLSPVLHRWGRGSGDFLGPTPKVKQPSKT